MRPLLQQGRKLPTCVALSRVRPATVFRVLSASFAASVCVPCVLGDGRQVLCHSLVLVLAQAQNIPNAAALCQKAAHPFTESLHDGRSAPACRDSGLASLRVLELVGVLDLLTIGGAVTIRL